jgi:hypothetical protein
MLKSAGAQLLGLLSCLSALALLADPKPAAHAGALLGDASRRIPCRGPEETVLLRIGGLVVSGVGRWNHRWGLARWAEPALGLVLRGGSDGFAGDNDHMQDSDEMPTLNAGGAVSILRSRCFPVARENQPLCAQREVRADAGPSGTSRPGTTRG